MTTIAIIGAGRGLGAAVARRFGREGFSVALLSRTQEHVDALAADLAAEGLTAAGFAADVRDRDALAAALAAAGERLGTVEVLQYSPLPHEEFMRPVLETTPEDLQAPFEFSVLGPVAAVRQVLPGMRELGRGTVLFVNGGTAVQPKAGFAGTSVGFAGESAYARMLHDALAEEGVHVAQLVVPGAIDPDSAVKSTQALADTLFAIHTDRDGFRTFAEPMEG